MIKCILTIRHYHYLLFQQRKKQKKKECQCLFRSCLRFHFLVMLLCHLCDSYTSAFIYGRLTCVFFSSLFEDCVCWEAKIQCKFPTHVPSDQGINILNFCVHSGHSDCPPSHDGAGHHCVYSCFYADWLGDAFGQLSFHSKCSYFFAK